MGDACPAPSGIDRFAHDTRQTFTTMRACLSQLQSQMRHDASAMRSVERLGVSIAQVERTLTAELIREVVEAPDSMYAPRKIDGALVRGDELMQIVADAAECASRCSSSSRRSYRVNFLGQESCDATVFDRTFLLFIVNAVIENAYQYAAIEGKLVLDVEVRVLPEHVSMVIGDHGPGIPSDELDLCVLPGFRGQGAWATATHGRGDGLFLARGAARALGGDLIVLTGRSRGAAFDLHLPAAL